MKQSLYIYNNGDLKRKDNTLQFTTYEGEKRAVNKLKKDPLWKTEMDGYTQIFPL